MKTLNIIVSATVSTLLMTAYSYYKSVKHQDQYIEPQLLTALMKKGSDSSEIKADIEEPEGWAVHFGVGVSYNIVYDQLWRKTAVEPTMISGPVIGLISGVAGIAAWKLMFSMNPNPPKINYTRFYRQLLGAHVIFGFSSALCYSFLETLKNRVR